MKLICPICAEDKSQYPIYEDNVLIYQIGDGRPFFDAEGRRHQHVKEGEIIKYKCSNKHEWEQFKARECQYCGKWWNK